MNICDDFLSFLAASPTPYHAAENLGAMFSRHRFEELKEDQSWQLAPGNAYYYTRSDSTIVAFRLGQNNSPESGIRLVGAHTDSPCLKLKPSPEKNVKHYQQVSIEVYGGALLNPWFDRDLSLAGKVCFLNGSGKLETTLVNFREPIAFIPSLAIHLDRDVNKKRSVNPQTDMNPILFQGSEEFCIRELLRKKIQQDGHRDAGEVLDFDLSLYDTQAPNVVGLKQEFIAGARLDNLLSSFIGAYALATSSDGYTGVMVCNDHEEIGSRTEIGAQGTVVEDLLDRLFGGDESKQIALRRSLMLSVDNAHGVHPNYVNRHDESHGPILNQGPVLKFDANQSYATSAHTAAFVKNLGRQEPSIPLQTYVTRADMRCGSTIGPLTASNIGVKTLDLGVPTFGMHSCRELGGKADLEYLYQLLHRFYETDDVALATSA